MPFPSPCHIVLFRGRYIIAVSCLIFLPRREVRTEKFAGRRAKKELLSVVRNRNLGNQGEERERERNNEFRTCKKFRD